MLETYHISGRILTAERNQSPDPKVWGCWEFLSCICSRVHYNFNKSPFLVGATLDSALTIVLGPYQKPHTFSPYILCSVSLQTPDVQYFSEQTHILYRWKYRMYGIFQNKLTTHNISMNYRMYGTFQNICSQYNISIQIPDVFRTKSM